MRIRHTTKSRRGAGIVEYGLIVGLIAVGAVVAVQNSGDRVSGLLNAAAGELGNVQNSVSAARDGATVTGPTENDPMILTTGSTSEVVERRGFQVRCDEWSDSTCTMPMIRATSNPCDTNEWDPTGVWHEQRQGADRVSAWCEIATGNPTVLSEGRRQNTGSPYAYGVTSTLINDPGSNNAYCSSNVAQFELSGPLGTTNLEDLRFVENPSINDRWGTVHCQGFE